MRERECVLFGVKRGMRAGKWGTAERRFCNRRSLIVQYPQAKPCGLWFSLESEVKWLLGL